MPGIGLNKVERKLLDAWNAGRFGTHSLTGIRVQGVPGLRGIQDLDIRFNYPLTVLCGRNGSGKSTILALAVLGFHSPPTHNPIDISVRLRAATRNYYTFQDFFYRGPGDPNLTGLQIVWDYQQRAPLPIQKRTDKWMHYERRPKRPVYYVGISRSVPAFEQAVLRRHFGSTVKVTVPGTLSGAYLARLGEIMQRQYSEAAVLESRKYSVRRVESGNQYSSFNMGAGEDILVQLLWLFEQATPGALIVIEEIELGIHPEALQRLAENMLEIMLEKQLQVIVSTHSEHFIDAVPRISRILCAKAGNENQVIYGPTTRYAVREMGGRSVPELVVYCEDQFSSSLIHAALNPEQRRRCQVVPIGGKSELHRAARLHSRVSGAKQLVVWDGDVTDEEIHSFVNAAEIPDLQYARLPGDEAPELWAVKQINSPEGRNTLRPFLPKGTTDAQVEEYCNRLAAEKNKDRIVYVLADLTSTSEEKAGQALVDAVARLSTDPMSEITTKIQELLDEGLGSYEAAATRER